MTTGALDFKKSLPSYRAKRGVFEFVDVPPMHYLMIDGRGDPNTSREYAEAIACLFPVAYKLKFASKRELQRDYVVPPLEALWWADDMESFTAARDKSHWQWTVMLMTPEWITREMFAHAVEQVRKASSPPKLDAMRFAELSEGRCVQTLHVGSFEDEAPVLESMHRDFIPAQGFALSGKHHEIYFTDFRKVEPAKLRTILRQPVIAGAGSSS